MTFRFNEVESELTNANAQVKHLQDRSVITYMFLASRFDIIFRLPYYIHLMSVSHQNSSLMIRVEY